MLNSLTLSLSLYLIRIGLSRVEFRMLLCCLGHPYTAFVVCRAARAVLEILIRTVRDTTTERLLNISSISVSRSVPVLV